MRCVLVMIGLRERRPCGRIACFAHARFSLSLSRPTDPTELTKNPVEGFSAGLVDDSNIFEWQVTIIGPPETL